MKFILQLILTLVLAGGKGFGLPQSTDGSGIGLIVMGSIVSRVKGKRENVALIKEVSSGKVRAVKVGFKVLERFAVKEVTEKYIIIWNPSEGEKLVYQDKFSSEFNRPQPVAQPIPQPASSYLSGRDTYKEDGFERDAQGNVNMTAAYRDKMLGKDLGTVMMQATAEPVMEGGRIIGFRMYQIDAGSIYDKAGIKDGDVITALNGSQLNNVQGAIKLLKSLKGANKVEFSIRRGDQSQMMRMNVD